MTNQTPNSREVAGEGGVSRAVPTFEMFGVSQAKLPFWEVTSYRLLNWWDMNKFAGNMLCSVCSYAGAIQNFWRAKKENESLSTQELNKSAVDISYIKEMCEQTAVANTAKYISENLFVIKPGVTFGELVKLFGNLQQMIHSEAKNLNFVLVREEHKKYFNQSEAFGPRVFDNFCSANDDIQEAGTCLALERPTACVMHLSRVVEAGLQALANKLGVKKQNDWGSYLRLIESELNKRFKTSGARTAEEQFYSEAHITFDAIKRAWRNPTMHVEKSYSPEKAEDIYIAVRSFMKHLAENNLSDSSKIIAVL